MSVRKTVGEVLGSRMTAHLWRNDYHPVLPVSVQQFDLSAVLPAVFYMFRFGWRRGQGQMQAAFGQSAGTQAQRRRSVTAQAIAKKLARDSNGRFAGFVGEAEQAVLGDLLLCYCLHNAGYKRGRDKQVQRVVPAHFMASWVDLPGTVANLRNVPEMIIAELANQEKSAFVETPRSSKRTWFPFGVPIRDNVLARPFAQGAVTHPDQLTDDLAGDGFDETADVGIDQLLMIALAERLGQAPRKLKVNDRIPNRRPLARTQSRYFGEDMRRYVQAYGDQLPRQALVETLESCFAVGLTALLSSVVESVREWTEDGEAHDSEPAKVFVDCSSGADRELRACAEQSMEDYMLRAKELPIHFMALRLLEYKARYDRKLKKIVNSEKGVTVDQMRRGPRPDEWLTLLGDLLHNRHPRSEMILAQIDEKTEELAEAIEGDHPAAAGVLRNEDVEQNPVWRLAEGLVGLQATTARSQLHRLIDSALFVDRPNGLGKKRRAQRTVQGRRRSVVLRSIVFTDSVLEYLIHLNLLKSGTANAVKQWFSFDDFISRIADRYGFLVDTSPAGMTLSNELLQRNRSFLDRRLRDLGLLISVNDAEAMKRLTPRIDPSTSHRQMSVAV